eukprot:c7873_g1_i1.p1 GENE.c7873_g1_i1~~c7873_g1_i1.p1  ORF type:complete len:1228 (+),score=286.20 c7873_g1_i1:491-3685(+)
MFGKLDSQENLGIIPRCCMELFELMENDEDGVEFTCSCSMLEIYREEMNDLLSPQVVPLHIKENRTGGVYVEGLTHEYVTDGEQVLSLIDLGNKAKVVASTKMNSESSRSHTIVVLDVVKKTKDGAALKGRLNLVDLAGSEKIKKTGAQGDTLEEAKKINLSLTALSHCIYALTKSDPHVPFRSSKLTRFLQNSLGGNSKTSLVVACASEADSFHETLSSLEFATRAKKIKNRVAANTELSPEALKDRMQAMEFELQSLQEYVRELEQVTLVHGIQLPAKDGGRMSVFLAPPGADSERLNSFAPPTSPHQAMAKRTVSAATPFTDEVTIVVDTTRSRALTETEIDQLREEITDGDERDIANLSLKDRFNERMQMLAQRTKTRLGGGVTTSEAQERASHLAQAPDLDRQFSFDEFLAAPPPPPPLPPIPMPRNTRQSQEELLSQRPFSPSSEIVEQRAEINALNSEIESIYSLVLAHEEEMARFLEAKNLEVAALKLQLEQQMLQSHSEHLPTPSVSGQSDCEPEDEMRRLGTMDGGNKGLHNTPSAQQLMATTTFRTMKTPSELTDQGPPPPQGSNLDSSDSTNAKAESAEQPADQEPNSVQFVPVENFKATAPIPDAIEADEPKSEAFQNLQQKLQEQNQALELQQGVLVKQQDILGMLQRKVLELTRENKSLQGENGSLSKKLKESQARTGELEHELAFLKFHRRGSNKPHGFERSGSDANSKIVAVVVAGRHRRPSASPLGFAKLGSMPLNADDDSDRPGAVPRSHTVQLPANSPMDDHLSLRQAKKLPPPPVETETPPPPPPAPAAAPKPDPEPSSNTPASEDVETPGDLTEHRGAVPKKLTCLCTQELITDQTYCEYQTVPSMKWHPAKYSEEVVRSLKAGGFNKYLKDLELASRDCSAAVRRLIKDGPPTWIKDAKAMPIPTSDTHICAVWFASTNTQISARLVGALEGEARSALWATQKEILTSMEEWEEHNGVATKVEEQVMEKENALEQAVPPTATTTHKAPPRNPRTQARKSTGSTSTATATTTTKPDAVAHKPPPRQAHTTRPTPATAANVRR